MWGWWGAAGGWGWQAVVVDVSRRRGQAAPEIGAALPVDPDAVELILTDAAPAAAAPVFTSPRCRLADRAAQFLADPPPGRSAEPLPEELDTSVSAIGEVAGVLADAAGVVAGWRAGAVRVARGRAGVVVRVHAEAWSLVFRVGGRVLIVLDRAPGTVWRIDRDRDWAPEIDAMIDGVMRELDRHALGDDQSGG